MSGINKVILVGRLGRDPEVKTFEGGAKKASFSLATSEVYKDKNGNKVEKTEWHNIICWRRWADIVEQYVTKGKLLYVEGKLRTRSWEENGAKRYITEIEVNFLSFLSAKSEEGNKPTETKLEPPTPQGAIPEPEVPDYVDDLPF